MSSEGKPERLFKIVFYTDLNAFEIYKCKGVGDESVDNDCEFHGDGDFWNFCWGDSLKINWIGDKSGPKHFLKFYRKSETNSKCPRKHPTNNFSKGERFEIQRNDKITFIKDVSDVAEWSFDFYWGESEGVDLTASNSIDPNAKIKDTPF